ncbi:MAG: glutathione S-transferase family protein [Leptolyngbyaceae bacterium]|nr:glutathione S-transferase family protein [Leptolyngbyaceae bacterium]
MTIKLYELAAAEGDRRFSPFCWRIRMALAHKGLDAEHLPVRFTEKDIIAFSNQGRVPVLVDGDRTVVDSWQIANYLDETYPDKPSLLGDAASRSLTLFVKHWDESVLPPLLFPLIILDIFKNIHEKDREYFRSTREAKLGKTLEEFADRDQAEALEAFRKALTPLRNTLQDTPYLAGDRPAFADYILLGRFQIARCMSPVILLEADDPIYGWRDRMLDAFGGLARHVPAYDL